MSQINFLKRAGDGYSWWVDAAWRPEIKKLPILFSTRKKQTKSPQNPDNISGQTQQGTACLAECKRAWGGGGWGGVCVGSASNMFLRLNVFAQVCSPQWWGNYSTETETLRGPVLCVKICNSVTPELKFAAGVPVVIFTVERRSPIM